MGRVYQRCEGVLWNPVGRDPEELLLVAEGEETRIFVLSGRTAATLWTRLDGTCSVEALARELSEHAGVPLKAALEHLVPFVEELEALHLIEIASSSSSVESPSPLPWPESLEPPCVIPFSPEDLAAPDLVAVGSYQGGHDNTGRGSVCHSGVGGFNNYGGNGPCRPGHGWDNSGHGPKCN